MRHAWLVAVALLWATAAHAQPEILHYHSPVYTDHQWRNCFFHIKDKDKIQRQDSITWIHESIPFGTEQRDVKMLWGTDRHGVAYTLQVPPYFEGWVKVRVQADGLPSQPMVVWFVSKDETRKTIERCDLDGDGYIGLGDFLIFSQYFGMSVSDFSGKPARWSALATDLRDAVGIDQSMMKGGE